MASPLATAIRNQVPILDLVQEYVSLKQSGAEYKGLSPFTQEKTPSFFVAPAKNVYYCFSTKKGGDVISFIMEVEKLEYKEALRFLAQKYAIHASEEEKTEQETYSNYVTLYKRLAKTLHYCLYNHPGAERARNYLRERGISEAIQKVFQIGYAPENPQWMIDFLSTRGYSVDFLKKAGIMARYKGAFFRNRIMFPLINQQNEYLGFGGRALDTHGPKYLHSPETIVFKKKRFFYGLNHAKQDIQASGKVYLVEGYFDVIACYQAGIKNVVAPLGTAVSLEALQVLLVYTSTIVLVFDSDDAGMRAAVHIANLVTEANIQLKGVLLPEKKDPADLIVSNGARAFQELLHQEGDIFELLLAYNLKRHDNVVGPIYNTLFPYISQIRSQMSKDECLMKIAHSIRKRQEDVEKDYEYFLQRGSRKYNQADSGNSASSFAKKLLLLAATNWHYFNRLREDSNGDDYEEKQDKKLFFILEDAFRAVGEKKQDFPSLVCSEIHDTELRKQVLASIFHKTNFDTGMKVIEDGILRLQKERLKHKKRTLTKKSEQTNDNYGSNAVRIIADEIAMIDKKLHTTR